MIFDDQIETILKSREIFCPDGFQTELHTKFFNMPEFDSPGITRNDNPYSTLDLTASLASDVSLRHLSCKLDELVYGIFYPYFGAISKQFHKEASILRFMTMHEDKAFVTGTISISGSNYIHLAKEFEKERNLILKSVESQ